MFRNSIDISQEEVLTRWSDGSIRINGSRVTLDTLVALVKNDETVEQIQEGFPSLSGFQINEAINWYLHNQPWADKYLKARIKHAETLRLEVESDLRSVELRERIRSKRDQLNP